MFFSGVFFISTASVFESSFLGIWGLAFLFAAFVRAMSLQ